MLGHYYLAPVKQVVGGMATLIGLLWASFLLYARLQEERFDSSREWFKKVWVAIDQSKWLKLPETLTSWLLYRPFVFMRWLPKNRIRAKIFPLTPFVALPMLFIITLLVETGPRLPPMIIVGLVVVVWLFNPAKRIYSEVTRKIA